MDHAAQVGYMKDKEWGQIEAELRAHFGAPRRALVSVTDRGVAVLEPCTSTDADIIRKAMDEVGRDNIGQVVLGQDAQLSLVAGMRPYIVPGPPVLTTLYGIPVHVDPALPEGEIRLIDGDLKVLRIVRIGKESRG